VHRERCLAIFIKSVLVEKVYPTSQQRFRKFFISKLLIGKLFRERSESGRLGMI
jgi:hypothetical protein